MQNNTKKPRRKQSGFTILELMAVIAIIGILAAIVLPNVMGNVDKAKVDAAKADINNLMKSLKLYKLDNGQFPSGEQGLQALVNKPTSGSIPANWRPYIEKKLPADPWGNPYQYLNPGVEGDVDIMSYGADGAEGGEGDDADIGSWQ